MRLICACVLLFVFSGNISPRTVPRSKFFEDATAAIIILGVGVFLSFSYRSWKNGKAGMPHIREVIERLRQEKSQTAKPAEVEPAEEVFYLEIDPQRKNPLTAEEAKEFRKKGYKVLQ